MMIIPFRQRRTLRLNREAKARGHTANPGFSNPSLAYTRMLRCPSKWLSRKLHCFENGWGCDGGREKSKQTKQEILHFCNHFFKPSWGLRPTGLGEGFLARTLFAFWERRPFIVLAPSPWHGPALPTPEWPPVRCHPDSRSSLSLPCEDGRMGPARTLSALWAGRPARVPAALLASFLRRDEAQRGW